MSEDERCTCSGEHSKHTCCKIIKVQKDFNFNLKNSELNFDLNFFYSKITYKEEFTAFSFKNERNINIHSPPIFLKNQNFLI